MSEQQHMVVYVQDNTGLQCLCFTEGADQPAVFNDSAFAELLASQLRDKYPQLKFRVLSFQVL
jgi:hypothetical protein